MSESWHLIRYHANGDLIRKKDLYQNCRDPGLNQGPSDLQSDALPTELLRLIFTCLGVWPAPLFHHVRSVHFIQFEDMKKHLKGLLQDLFHWKYYTDLIA